MYNDPFFDDVFYLGDQSYYSGEEIEDHEIYPDEEESSFNSSFSANQSYFSKKIKMMTQKCNVKYRQYKKKSKTDIFLSETELDNIDEILEKIMISNEEKKQKYKSMIEKTFEDVKIQLLGRLEKEFESLFDLVDNYSEFSLFEELVRKFQDNKSEYEMNQSTQNFKQMKKTLNNIFSFDEIKNLYLTLNDRSIQTVIEQTSLFYIIFLQNIEINWPKDYEKCSRMVADIKKSSTELFDFFKNDQDLLFGDILVNYNYKDNKTHFVNSELQQFRTKFSFFENEISNLKKDAIKSELIPIGDLLKNIKEKEKMKLYKTYILNKNKNYVILEYVDETYNTNFTKLFLMSLKDKGNNLNLIKEIQGKIEKILISPDDNFLAIKFKNKDNKKVLIYNLLNKKNKFRFFISKILKKNLIKSFIFLDSVDGLRFIFTDIFGTLNIVNLETLKLELTLDFLNLISVHYINDEQILVINRFFKMGVFSMKTKSVCNFVDTNILLEKTFKGEVESKVKN